METITVAGVTVPANWKKREIHEKEVNDILLSCGCFLEGTRKIVRWNGPVVHPALQKAGHSSLDYDNCECQKGKI